MAGRSGTGSVVGEGVDGGGSARAGAVEYDSHSGECLDLFGGGADEIELPADHGLVFARDGFKLQKGRGAGGPQDPEKGSARWRTVRSRLHLPEDFRLHDLRASKITNDLDNKENPVEVSANARHHSPGYTMARHGRRRAEGAKKLAASSAGRIGLSSLV
ncbi:hypothetical protein ACFV6F_29575 [Kitasatospora phosalacinea]|uniref:hypothetical protein n=1 Tax=Kitasatospora phosalacinea TaxID=2065 RepID=UPI00365A7010